MHYYAIESSSSLTHHGVKGMKWGVRRYQDYDGHRIGSKKLKSKPRLFGLFNKKNKSSTDLGSKVPEKKDDETKDSSKKLSNAIASDPVLSKVDKDYWAPDWDKARIKGSEDHENAMAAANLGLKALQKLKRYDDTEPITGADREWFLFEDQTIGLPTAAHLINKGHSADDVKRFYKTINDNYDYYTDYDKYFDVIECGGANDFIDACKKVKSSK